MCLTGLYSFKYHKQIIKPFLFFSAWFLSGFFFCFQIFPLDATIADRWFYFPMAGLLGLLGLLYQNFAKKLPQYIALLLSVVIIGSLTVRTILRNSNWHDTITLYSHDSQITDNFDIENNLGNKYLKAKDYSQAIQHFQKSIELRPFEYNLNNLGVAYVNQGNLQQAKKYFELSFRAKNYQLDIPHKHNFLSWKSYASFLTFYDNPSTAVSFIKNALNDYPDSSDLLFFLALGKYKQHDTQGALDAATKAYQLSPNEQDTFIYMNIQKKESFTINYYNKSFTFDIK